MPHQIPDTDLLLSQLAALLNTRMRLRELRRRTEQRHAESLKCSAELDALLAAFHAGNLSATTDGLAD